MVGIGDHDRDAPLEQSHLFTKKLSNVKNANDQSDLRDLLDDMAAKFGVVDEQLQAWVLRTTAESLVSAVIRLDKQDVMSGEDRHVTKIPQRTSCASSAHVVHC